MTSSDVHSPEMQLAFRPFLHDVESSPDEQSIERALKLALRRLPENKRLTFFAQAITSPLPHAAKAALWRVSRKSCPSAQFMTDNRAGNVDFRPIFVVRFIPKM